MSKDAAEQQGMEFVSETVVLDGRTFVDCRFEACELVFRGDAVATLRRCHYTECEWVFVKQGNQTVQLWATARSGFRVRARHWASNHVASPVLEAFEFLVLFGTDMLQWIGAAFIWHYGIVFVNKWAPEGSKAVPIVLLKIILTVGLLTTISLAILRNIKRGYAGPLTYRGRRQAMTEQNNQ